MPAYLSLTFGPNAEPQSADMRHLRLTDEGRFRQAFDRGPLSNVNRPSYDRRRQPWRRGNLLHNSIIDADSPPWQRAENVRGRSTQGEMQPLRAPAKPYGAGSCVSWVSPNSLI